MADLITAFKDALDADARRHRQEFFVERISIADAIAFLLDRLKDEGSIRFEDIVAHCQSEERDRILFSGHPRAGPPQDDSRVPGEPLG